MVARGRSPGLHGKRCLLAAPVVAGSVECEHPWVLCLELTINGERKATAGVPGDGVLTFTATWVKGKNEDDGLREERELRLGGIDSCTEEFVDWMEGQLEVGDVVTLRVIEQDEAGPPGSRRSVRDAGMDVLNIQRMQLRHFEKRVERTKAIIRELEARGPA